MRASQTRPLATPARLLKRWPGCTPRGARLQRVRKQHTRARLGLRYHADSAADAAQVRWAKQSLEKLRVGSWRGPAAGGDSGALAASSALALQREMLHTVAALHQFVCDRVVQSASRELANVSCLGRVRPSLPHLLAL